MGEEPTNDELVQDFQQNTMLSKRESQVLVWLSHFNEKRENQQAAKKAVAERYELNPSTVDTYYRRALEKLYESAKLQDTAKKL